MALRSHDQFPGLSGVPAWRHKNKEVFQIGLINRLCVLFRIVPAWSLKNREVFPIGFVDCPAFSSASSPHRALKTWKVFQVEPTFFSLFFPMQCYYLDTLRESVSPELTVKSSKPLELSPFCRQMALHIAL